MIPFQVIKRLYGIIVQVYVRVGYQKLKLIKAYETLKKTHTNEYSEVS